MMQNNQHHDENMTFVRLALALANDYQAVYLINTEDDSYALYHTVGENKELVQTYAGKDFYHDTIEDYKATVYPPDQDYFLETFKKEHILSALENGHSFFITYRIMVNGAPHYYTLKTIRGTGKDDKYIIIGVRDVDEQMRREQAAAEQSRTYSEIAESLALLYEVIYRVDVADDTYTEYSASKHYAALNLKRDGKDFFTLTLLDIQKVVHPDDVPMLAAALEKETLLARLYETGSYSITYRQMLDGRMQYVSLIAVLQRNDSHPHIVFAVRNIDEQKRREFETEAQSETYLHIAKALASRYEVIYYIDLKTNTYLEYCSSMEYAKLGVKTAGTDFFKAMVPDIRQFIHPDDAAWLIDALQKEKLLHTLEISGGSVRYSYRQVLENGFKHVTSLIVMPKDDPNHIVMAVLNIDAQIRREQEITRESETYAEIVRALAQRYEVIYYVNIETNEYREYSASEKYAKLKIGETGTDFFSDTERNMKRDIYPEDYQMLADAMTKEHLIESLRENGTMTLGYRLILDNTPQYVTLFAIRPKADSKHIIIAVVNVDAAKRRELAFKDALGTAMNMANRDALTGVKNKHAYTQTEREMNMLISSDSNPPFAIVVCDVNGLKEVNDTQGHNAGDAFIKSACYIICNTFKHSPVFRIGGDEFAILLKGIDYDCRQELMETLDSLVKENKQNKLVTVASGISEFDFGMDASVQQVFERADQAMYENKKQFKKRFKF